MKMITCMIYLRSEISSAVVGLRYRSHQGLEISTMKGKNSWRASSYSVIYNPLLIIPDRNLVIRY